MAKMFSGINYIGKSTEDKPQEAKNGEAFYEVDTNKVYIWYDGQWWEM